MPILQHFCQAAGSNPYYRFLFVVLCIRKEPQKVHQPFRPDPTPERKKSGSEVADRPLRSPISLYFARFTPKMQEKTSFAMVDKRGFFVGSGWRIRTLTNGVRVRCATITQTRYRALSSDDFASALLLYAVFQKCQDNFFFSWIFYKKINHIS